MLVYPKILGNGISCDMAGMARRVFEWLDLSCHFKIN